MALPNATTIAVGRRSPALHAASVSLARSLTASSDATRGWIGKTALRELTSPKIAEQFVKGPSVKSPKKTR